MDKLLIFGYINVGIVYFLLFLNFVFGNLTLPIVVSILVLMIVFVLSWLGNITSIDYKIFGLLSILCVSYVLFFLL